MRILKTLSAKAVLPLVLLLGTPNGVAFADFNQGLILLQQKYYDEAAVEFEKEVKSHKDNDKAWYYLGLSYLKAKKYGEAQRAFRGAVELKPDEYEYRSLLGKAYFGGEKWQEAAMAFEAALPKAPDDKAKYECHWFTGSALLRLKNYSAAATALRKANDIKPNLELTILIGDTQFSGGDYSGAISSYERALQAKPDDANLLRKLTYSLVKKATAPGASTDEAATQAAWAKIAEVSDQAIKAMEAQLPTLQANAQTDPKTLESTTATIAEFARLRAQAQALGGGSEQAIANYLKALELNPADCATMEELGNIYLSVRRISDAETTLAAANTCASDALTALAAAGGTPAAGAPSADDLKRTQASALRGLGSIYLEQGAVKQEEGEAAEHIPTLEQSVTLNRKALEKFRASNAAVKSTDVEEIISALEAAIAAAQENIEIIRFNQDADKENAKREADYQQKLKLQEEQQRAAQEAAQQMKK